MNQYINKNINSNIIISCLILNKSEYDLIIKMEKKIRHIASKYNFDDIKGVLYGPKCSTYRFVKDCIPWNCFSFILNSRTYDFQTFKYSEYLNLIDKIKYNPKLINLNQSNDFFAEIDNNKRLWMNINYGNFKRNKNSLPVWYKEYSTQKNYLDVNNYTCCICLDNFNNVKCIKTLQCDHVFHKYCIDKWIDKKNSCPICRSNIK